MEGLPFQKIDTGLETLKKRIDTGLETLKGAISKRLPRHSLSLVPRNDEWEIEIDTGLETLKD